MSDSRWWPVEVVLPDGQTLRVRMTGQEWVLGVGWCCRVEFAVWDWAPPRPVYIPALAPAANVRRVSGVDYEGVPVHDHFVLAQATGGQMVLHYQRCPVVREPESDGVVVPDGAARESLDSGRTTPCPRCQPVVSLDEARSSVERAARS